VGGKVSQFEDAQRRRRVLEQARRIAVLGASPKPNKPSHYVGQYLTAQGYEVHGVSAVYVGQSLFGRPVVGSVVDVPGPVDLVDVFRRAEALPEHLSDLLAAAPRAVWFQSGIRHAEVAEALRRAGIEVIEDRCTMVEHRALSIPAKLAKSD
jgi:predicted CoA-binding protein